MNELIIDEDIKIENMIYEIRGKQVMLDRDLAKLYECSNGTKDINKAVKRNIEKFPEDFYFKLTNEEIKNLCSRFHFGTLNIRGNLRGSNIKYAPYVFTEQGVAMLASVLRTPVAARVSVDIMRAFVAMRHYVNNSELRLLNVESKVLSHDNDILLLKESFNKFNNNINLSGIYYKGQIYDAYSAVIKICKKAEDKIIIIDNFSDENLLDIISKLDVEVILITDKKNTYLKSNDIDKYNEEYHNLKVVYDNSFHDRFFIIDDKEIYHCGSSVNRVGYKTFAINKIEDEIIINRFMDEVNLVVENDNESKVGLDE